jgi:hypothetical protein
MTLRELITKIGFTVDERGLDVYDKAIGRIYTKTDKLYRNLERAADGITKVGMKMSMYLTAPLVGLATVSVMAESKLDNLQNKWGVLLGSQKKGAAMTDQFYETAKGVESNADQVAAFAQEMHRLGYATKDIIPDFKVFSNIAAGTGQDIGTMIEYTQMMINSPASAGMILKRMQRQHMVSAQAMRAVFGVDASTAYGQRRLMQMAQSGRIDASSIMSLFQREGGPGGRYWGKSEERTHTLSKKTQLLSQSFFLLRAKIGETLDKSVGLQKWIERLTNFMDKLRNILDKTSPGMKTLIVVLGGIAVATGPALVGVGKLLSVFTGILTTVAMLKIAGFAGIFGNIAKAIGGIMVTAGPVLILLSAIALIAQDIFMYMKFGDQANTLTGSLAAFLNNSNNPIVQGINGMLDAVVGFFYQRWTEVKAWWDNLWANPWATLENMLPDWIKNIISENAFDKDRSAGNVFGTGSAQAAAAYSGTGPSSVLGAGRNVVFQTGSIVIHPPAGSTATQIQALDDHFENHIMPRVAKRLTDQLYNQHKD